MHLSQHTLCTRKMEVALEVKFCLDFHWVSRPWRQTLTNRNDVKYVFPRSFVSEFAGASTGAVHHHQHWLRRFYPGLPFDHLCFLLPTVSGFSTGKHYIHNPFNSNPSKQTVPRLETPSPKPRLGFIKLNSVPAHSHKRTQLHSRTPSRFIVPYCPQSYCPCPVSIAH